MMKILGLEVSGNACSVALCHGDEYYKKTVDAPKKQGALILSMVDSALTTMGLVGNDLDVIAFDCGPGSFTGVRLTTAVAQGLAFGWNKLLLPISSLQALAYKKYREDKTELPIWVAIDARKQEVYVAAYQFQQGDVIVVYPEQVVAPEQVPFADFSLLSTPEAIDLLNLALYQITHGVNPVAADEVQPIYLRNKVTD